LGRPQNKKTSTVTIVAEGPERIGSTIADSSTIAKIGRGKEKGCGHLRLSLATGRGCDRGGVRASIKGGFS